MKILKLITAGLAMLFVSSNVTAIADDVMVRHMTKEGKTERLIVDHTQLPELQKAIRESKPLDRFKASPENRVSSLIKSPMRDPAGPQDPERPEGFAVRFAVEDEEAPEGHIYQPFKVYICKGDGEYDRAYYNYAYYPDEEMIEQGYAWGCYVPEGEYTIILCSEIFTKNIKGEWDLLTYLYVVKENVEINHDTDIIFRQSDAKNCITASCMLPNGSEAPGDNYLYDEKGQIIGFREDICVSSCRSFVNTNSDYCLNLGNFEGSLDLVYVNDLSSNWVYVINMSVVDANGAYSNCVTRPGPITSSLHIQNNPSDYKLTTVRFDPNIPGVNPDVKGFGVVTKIAWKGADWNLPTEGVLYNQLGITDELPIYINATASDIISPTAFDLITIPVVATNIFKEIAEDWDGTPILNENGEQVYYYFYSTLTGPGIYNENGDKYICIDSEGYRTIEYPAEHFLLPYDQLFSFEKTSDIEFFSGAPILSISTFTYPYFFYMSPLFYYPTQSAYNLPYTFTIKYNNTLLAENETPETFNIYAWSNENYDNPGIFDINLCAAWKADDPNAIVRNTIHIDTQKEDKIVPQVIRWQLRTEEGALAYMATSSSKIHLMCREDMDNKFKLSVSSPEIEDYEFNIKMLHDLYYEDGKCFIRQIYEVSLEDFPGDVGKKYSLQFNLSDASGNTSTQTIGNAFEWAGTTSINSVAADNNVYVADGILHAPADAEVFTIDGRHADRNALASGLYIVKTGNKTTKVLVP